MPAIPVFRPRGQAEAALQARLPGDFGQAVPAAQARAGDTLGQVGTRIFEVAQDTAYHNGVVQFAQGLQTLRGEVSRETDPVRMGERWEEGSRALMDEVGQTMPGIGPSRSDFARSAALWVSRETPDIQRMQASRATQQATAATINLRDTLAAEAARDPARFPLLAEQFDEALRTRVQSGALPEDRAERMRAEFARSVSRARVRREIQQNPGAARQLLMDPQRYSGLSPDDRQDLASEATSLEAEAERTSIAEAAQVERSAWQTAETQAKETFGRVLVADGADPVELDREVEWARNVMPVSSYDCARKVLSGQVAQSDDGETVARLTQGAASDPATFRREAEGALLAETITPQRFQSLMQTNERAHGDTAEARAYRSGRGALSEAFDGPEEVGLGRARVAALSDFDDWAAANPRATAAEMRQAAQDIAGIHRPAAVAQGRASLPEPYGFAGWPDDVDEPVIDAAEEVLIGDLDAGYLTVAEAARQVRALNAWRFVLRQQGTQK